MQPTRNFEDLVSLMAKLRAECPWDKKQTNESLLPFLLEEAYEYIEAVHANDEQEIKAELGDVLLQVVFHACLYAEVKADNHSSGFDIGDVIYTLMEKLIRRHPHVFEKESLSVNGVLDEEAVNTRWEQIKVEEKAQKKADAIKKGKPYIEETSLIKKLPMGSALIQANELQKKVAKVGFDWADVQGAQEKLTEELAELDEAIVSANKEAITDELGDCLFALVNVARKLNIDPEIATLSTINKFKQRFSYIEDQLTAKSKSLKQASLQEMDVLWEQAKQFEPKNNG